MQSAVSASTKINDHVGHCLDAVPSVNETQYLQTALVRLASLL